jgi:hypothetical protein
MFLLIATNAGTRVAKGLDGGDRVLAKSVAERLIHALRMQAKRGKIAVAGKERGAILWSTRG